MSKFIKSILLFFIFLTIFYFLSILIWGKFSPIKKNINYKIGIVGHTFTRLKEVKKEKDIDLLFLGSSHAYYGLDTRIFSNAGYKSFNLGTNNQTPIQAEILLNRYLDNLNPKLVVLDVCPVIFSRDGIESSLVLISNDNFGFDFVKLALKLNHLKIYNTLIFKIWQEILYDDINTFVENKLDDDENYIRGGFVENKLKYYMPEKHENKKWVYDDKIFESFYSVIEILKKRNIKFILIQTPITSDFYNSYSNNQEFDDEMKKYGTYYNFNELMQLNDTIHFQDPNHLNKIGIKIFNENVLDILNKKR